MSHFNRLTLSQIPIAAGNQIIAVLENGVSAYPKLEGRFLQVSGISFAFDPTKPPHQRVDTRFVRIGDQYLDLEAKYRVVTKAYLRAGKDGFDILKNTKVLVRKSLNLF